MRKKKPVLRLPPLKFLPGQRVFGKQYPCDIEAFVGTVIGFSFCVGEKTWRYAVRVDKYFLDFGYEEEYHFCLEHSISLLEEPKTSDYGPKVKQLRVYVDFSGISFPAEIPDGNPAPTALVRRLVEGKANFNDRATARDFANFSKPSCKTAIA